MARDFYEVLGVKRNAELTAIREAYRTQAKVLHPSRGGDPKAFAELEDAYFALSNPSRRKQYDEDQSAPAKEIKPKQTRIQVPDAVEEEPIKPGQTGLALGDVPEHLEKPVAHILITERDGYRSLQMANTFPAIDDGRLKPGEVLLGMRAVPLCRADLNLEDLFQPGDVFGLQGIAQVALVGPQVTRLQKGDWVIPLCKVDEDGDLVEDAPPPGTGRALVVLHEDSCAKVNVSPQAGLAVSQLALAKSVATGCKMVEDFAEGLEEGTSVILNCANGVVGQTLLQLLSRLNVQVFAVIRRPDEDSDDEDYEREEDQADVERCKKHLRDLGATHVFFDDDDIRSNIESLGAPLPLIAFDGVGGDATMRLAMALNKGASGKLVVYGTASGSRKQVLPPGWGKKWKGLVMNFSFDEWIQKDREAGSQKLSDILQQAARMMQVGTLILDVEEHSTKDFTQALRDMMRLRRTNAVVLHFPREDDSPEVAKEQVVEAVPESASQVMAGPRVSASGTHLPPVPTEPATAGKPAKMSWDLDFLRWEEEDEDSREKCKAAEGNLFQHDPVMDELRMMPFTDDALACPVALEIGEEKGKAMQVLFWLPGEGEVPEEHGPWLSAFAANHPGLRVLVLRPRSGFKWFELSDGEAVKLGLNYLVMDDMDTNMNGDPGLSGGEIAFPPLNQQEVTALQQIEGVSIGLARRAVLEEREIESARSVPGKPVRQLPFFFGGFGQGGTVALFAAVCLMEIPVSGVVFSHSGVPAAGMLGKRLSDAARRRTKLCAVYDRADKEVPCSFPEALQHMFSLMGCRISLEWLNDGNGHDFFDDASAKVMLCLEDCFEDAIRTSAKKDSDIQDHRRMPNLGSQQIMIDQTFREKWRASVQRRGGKVSDLVLRGGPLKVS